MVIDVKVFLLCYCVCRLIDMIIQFLLDYWYNKKHIQPML